MSRYKYDFNENLEVLFDLVGEEAFVEIVKLYGGNNLYIPTYSSMRRSSRNDDILKRYNGVNASMLAREYGISVNHLKYILSNKDL